jgi:hypothetical protein
MKRMAGTGGSLATRTSMDPDRFEKDVLECSGQMFYDRRRGLPPWRKVIGDRAFQGTTRWMDGNGTRPPGEIAGFAFTWARDRRAWSKDGRAKWNARCTWVRQRPRSRRGRPRAISSPARSARPGRLILGGEGLAPVSASTCDEMAAALASAATRSATVPGSRSATTAWWATSSGSRDVIGFPREGRCTGKACAGGSREHQTVQPRLPPVNPATGPRCPRETFRGTATRRAAGGLAWPVRSFQKRAREGGCRYPLTRPGTTPGRLDPAREHQRGLAARSGIAFIWTAVPGAPCRDRR